MKKEIHSLTDDDIKNTARELDMEESDIDELDTETIAEIYKRKFEWNLKHTLLDMLRDAILESKG